MLLAWREKLPMHLSNNIYDFKSLQLKYSGCREPRRTSDKHASLIKEYKRI